MLADEVCPVSVLGMVVLLDTEDWGGGSTSSDILWSFSSSSMTGIFDRYALTRRTIWASSYIFLELMASLFFLELTPPTPRFMVCARCVGGFILRIASLKSEPWRSSIVNRSSGAEHMLVSSRIWNKWTRNLYVRNYRILRHSYWKCPDLLCEHPQLFEVNQILDKWFVTQVDEGQIPADHGVNRNYGRLKWEKRRNELCEKD